MKNNKNLSLRSVRILKINRSAIERLDSFGANINTVIEEDPED
jgi:hypothetical protein